MSETAEAGRKPPGTRKEASLRFQARSEEDEADQRLGLWGWVVQRRQDCEEPGRPASS